MKVIKPNSKYELKIKNVSNAPIPISTIIVGLLRRDVSKFDNEYPLKKYNISYNKGTGIAVIEFETMDNDDFTTLSNFMDKITYFADPFGTEWEYREFNELDDDYEFEQSKTLIPSLKQYIDDLKEKYIAKDKMTQSIIIFIIMIIVVYIIVKVVL